MTCKHCGLEIEWSSVYDHYKPPNGGLVSLICHANHNTFIHEPYTHEQVNKLLNEYYG